MTWAEVSHHHLLARSLGDFDTEIRRLLTPSLAVDLSKHCSTEVMINLKECVRTD